MPDPVGNVPADDDAQAAINAAWEMHREVRRKRHDLHELVRLLTGARVADEFGEADTRSMEPKQEGHRGLVP